MNGPQSYRTPEILLVDDNPGDVGLTKAAFRHAKLTNHLTVARDGEEALQILRRVGPYSGVALPDLIMLDLNLPKISGVEVLGEIKKDPTLRRIPVVVMTSSTAEEDIARSYDLHANCYITKLVEFDQFRDAVKSIADFWFTLVRLPSNETAPLCQCAQQLDGASPSSTAT